jgi:hypothetical protein
VNVPVEESREFSAQGPCGDRYDPPHLVPPLAVERVRKLLDLAPGDPRQPERLLGSDPQLGTDACRVGEEPIPQHPIDGESRQDTLDLG